MKEKIKDYGKKSEFASFLPGIAGCKGIPIWCFYVNRGQCVVSFGVDNKDHAIMEYYPAHTAYQTVKTTGFRTFLKCDGLFTEPFADEEKSPLMEIEKNCLSIEETDSETGLTTRVTYFILPEEAVGALVRKVEITNRGKKEKNLEVIDGMPALIPYGVGEFSMKHMAQTTKAWMQVEDLDKDLPFYRVRVSMEDSAEVSEVTGGNFALAVDEMGQRLKAIADPEAVFAYDKSLQKPVRFAKGGLADVTGEKQNTSNLLPCAFFLKEKKLKAGESLTLYEMIGQVERKEYYEKFLGEVHDTAYFEEKEKRAVELTEELCSGIATHTADPTFDAYCGNAYMDNVLRGGYPIKLGNSKVFYVYSRKHGDLERDYNYFSMLPEYYSQGNGNYRDVNQNRRMDTFFSPFVGRKNIHTFMNLIQLDGYNPLSIEKLTYRLSAEKARNLFTSESLVKFTGKSFTPGSLYRALMDEKEKGADFNLDECFLAAMDFAEEEAHASFGEGYWCDHWTYNMDLIEEYLAVFPEKEKDLLMEDNYTFYLSQVNLRKRFKRYAKTGKGIRQYYALDETSKRDTQEKLLRDEKGQIVYTSLLAKLLLLASVKFATLDSYGMGIEMEGGKPGWYDALNGAPGMFASSMSETYELARLLGYVIHALETFPGKVELLKEVGAFIRELVIINDQERGHIEKGGMLMAFWNKINDAKESFRDRTYQSVSGERMLIDSAELLAAMKDFLATVERGIEKACGYGDVCPTYFTYEMTEYEETGEGIIPLEFEVRTLPYFLEGPVRYLKLQPKDKKELYRKVKESDLYDTKLHMYKVNASLESASYELGRARAFTPGWLENESVFLHMEYKYLLELLKTGLYEEFFGDFHEAAVPFQDPERYGRSTLENCSFLASSKNPNEKIHGKGFVARLSGSTVEFLSMWKRMMFGERPFYLEDGKLRAKLMPALPAYLIGKEKKVSATLLGTTLVTYEFAENKNYIPSQYEIAEARLVYRDGSESLIKGGILGEKEALDLRQGRIRQIYQKIK